MEQLEGKSTRNPTRQRLLLWVYRSLLTVGILLSGMYVFTRLGIWWISRSAVQQFDVQRSTANSKINTPVSPTKIDLTGTEANIDYTLWSPKRIQEFKESLKLEPKRTLAVLELERLRIRVPVFEGSDDLSLNLGAGWVEGTALPGEPDNTVIAAHRDGFFRVLKDVRTGDWIELEMKDKTFIYRVSSTEIIDKNEVRVLMPKGQPVLTLVTCYPFYFHGNAPQRFIVHADLQQTSAGKQDYRISY
jgi:sortase A